MPNRAGHTHAPLVNPSNGSVDPVPMPQPIRVMARQSVTDILWGSADQDLLSSRINEQLAHAFGEELQDALASMGTACVVGRIHNERTASNDPLAHNLIFERWCYIWPLPVPVEGVELPELRVGRSWFR